MSRNEAPASCSNDLMMEITMSEYPEETWSTEVWEDGLVLRLKEEDRMTVLYELSGPDGRIAVGIKRDREAAIEDAKYRLEAKKVKDLDDDELGPEFNKALAEGNEIRAGTIRYEAWTRMCFYQRELESARADVARGAYTPETVQGYKNHPKWIAALASIPGVLDY
jgi:hypothetical protein